MLVGTDGWWDLVSIHFLVPVAADSFSCNRLSINADIHQVPKFKRSLIIWMHTRMKLSWNN